MANAKRSSICAPGLPPETKARLPDLIVQATIATNTGSIVVYIDLALSGSTAETHKKRWGRVSRK
jgi:hypothetical protein